MDLSRTYGKIRTRSADVSYGEIEAAAQAILLTGVRPTVDGVRESLKAGSQRTLLSGLQRFWKELGERLSGVPDSHRRLPAAVANLADSLWQTALNMAADAAEGSDAAMRSQIEQLRADTDVRRHALAQREIEIDSLVRSRERTIKELEEHLRTTMALVNKRDATIRSLELRLAAALAETDGYRQRLAKVVAQAVKRHRTVPATRAGRHSRTASSRSRRAVRPNTARALGKRGGKRTAPSKRKTTAARRRR